MNRLTTLTITRHILQGSLYSVDWNGPLDYWNGLLEHACHKFEVSMTIVHLHACIHTAKKERLFNNGSVAGVASLSFYATQFL